ncbi:MAG: exodeoxyribonuclease VII large subunit [Wenzhouxiangellaceae bacterium]|nr:exodeoxyribonuclease VII large subunit [Wenzhouxiangellaceae bacterium]
MPISPPGPDVLVHSPTELNREVRVHIEAGFPRVWVSGELSNLARPASGHRYFTIKDDRAQLRCALFRGQAGNVQGDPANGDKVLVRGRLSLYEARGEFQLIADAMLPAGEGALAQAFEALKRKLEAEGLFAPERKRALPTYPSRIAVVTSATGAAVRDILTTLQRRWPVARVRLHAAQVQGHAAPASLLRALRAADADGCDVILLARGGGSLEDLWAFNDETLARAIAGAATPVVSGVGHETDFTIADFVADLRAATPTAAAEAVTPDADALLQHLDRLERRASRTMGRTLQQYWQRLDGLERRLAARHPARRLADAGTRLAGLMARLQRAQTSRIARESSRLDGLQRRLAQRHPGTRLAVSREAIDRLQARFRRAVRNDLGRHERRLAEASRALKAVSPLAVLARGYAVIEDERGRALTSRGDFAPGQRIRTRLRDGRVVSDVVATEDIGDAEE